MTSSQQTPLTAARGFSLIEVLAVLGILAVLVAGAAPAILSTVKASRLASAASQLTGRLNEAQGMALTFSSDFEVRFLAASPSDPLKRDSLQIYALADPEKLEEQEDDDDAFEPVGAPEILPESIVFSRNSVFSSLLRQEKGREAGGRRVLGVIRYHPDGSTSLPEGESWHVTLVESAEENAAKLPANFATIQVDPATGRLEVFRPE